MTRHASARPALISFVTFIFVAVILLSTPAAVVVVVNAQLDVYAQVAPELAQPDKVKTSSADAAEAAAAKAAAIAALDRSLPVCAKGTAKNSKNACALVRPGANDTVDDPAWSQFDAAYAGTVWLPPAPAAAKMHIKAAGSYYQISKLPLSRSTCVPGSLVAARLVFRLPATNGTKFTAGLLPRVNELADAKTVRRCVLSGVNGLATPQEAATAAASAVATSAGGCVECNRLVVAAASSSGGGGSYGNGNSNSASASEEQQEVKLCPSTPGVWYVDTLPLKVPTVAAGWCDEQVGDEKEDSAKPKPKPTKERLPEQDAFAAFVVNAGSEVDVAFFDVVPRNGGPSGAQSA